MQAKAVSKVDSSRDYQDYVPNTEVVEEKDCDTLLIYLPGFKKDQLRVQLTRTPTLKISGERPIADNKWTRFQKEHPVSKNCDTNKITAKFDSGILYIRQPKKHEEKPVNRTQNPQKNETEPPLPQNTDTKNVSNKMENEDKVNSKSEEPRVGDVAQTSQENGVENDDGKGKRKRVDEFLSRDFMKNRVKIAKKMGTAVSGVVLVIAAIMLGIYIKNLIMPTKNNEN